MWHESRNTRARNVQLLQTAACIKQYQLLGGKTRARWEGKVSLFHAFTRGGGGRRYNNAGETFIDESLHAADRVWHMSRSSANIKRSALLKSTNTKSG